MNKTHETRTTASQGRRSRPEAPKCISAELRIEWPRREAQGHGGANRGEIFALARDALASGDLVGAESYFQPAEHYNRIIMATQSQMGAHNSRQSGGDGGDIPDRRDGGRNMPGLGREHVRPEGGNGTEANHDAQADPHKSDEDGADPVS